MSIFTKDTALADIKSGYINGVVNTYLSGIVPGDTFLWGKLLAAEKEVSRRLGIPLEPTQVFPYEPSDEEVALLNGKPCVVEPGYDLPANWFGGMGCGTLKLRLKRVLSVDSIKIVYPTTGDGYQIPSSWLQVDKKYGMVTIIPGAGMMMATPGAAFATTALSAGISVPYMVKVRYSAGLDNVAEDYPDVLDVIYRMASMKILESSFIPQSGSVSADGLSQSFSTDVSKYRDSLDSAIDDLKAQLCGPTWGVL